LLYGESSLGTAATPKPLLEDEDDDDDEHENE
jgi:hypothetical protein